MSARDRRAVVVGIGQDAAGDDAVGLLVARTLSARGVAALESTDATVLLALLAAGRKVVVVDAVVGNGDAGDVLHLRPDALAEASSSVSSHGIGVAEALALARVLHGADALRAVEIVGVIVDGEPRLGSKLAPAVAAAVGPAAVLAERLMNQFEPSPSCTSRRCRRR